MSKQLEAILADQHRHDISYERLDGELRLFNALVPRSLSGDLVSLNVGLKVVIAELEIVKGLMRSDLVGRMEFEPIKRLVYGMVGVVLTAVLVALITMVVKR